MSPKQRTLVFILIFVIVTVGSFIWFIVTWDPEREESVTSIPPLKTQVLPT